MAKAQVSVFAKAVYFLSIRPLSELELLSKLRKAGYQDHECDAAIDECKRHHYLDDEQLTADCVELFHQRNIGAGQIKLKLCRRGLDAEKISDLLENSEQDEYDAARRAMEGKLRLLKRESDRRKKREKLFRFMASRGFASTLIFRIMDEFSEEINNVSDL